MADQDKSGCADPFAAVVEQRTEIQKRLALHLVRFVDDDEREGFIGIAASFEVGNKF